MATVTQTPRSVKRTTDLAMTLRIGPTAYDVSRIDAGEDGTRAYRLSKIDGDFAVYDVIRTHDGLVRCDCPHYELRLAGSSAVCKHGRALVSFGLMEEPRPAVRPTTPARVPEPSRPFGEGLERPEPAPSEPEPCRGCEPAPDRPALPAAVVIIDSERAAQLRAEQAAATADLLAGFDPSIGRFLAGIPEVRALAGPEPEPEPAAWPAWTDAERWEPTGAPGAVGVAVDPPGPDGSLTLLQWVEGVAAGFRGLDTAAADLVAEAVEALARGIRCTDARDPATYRDRIAALDAFA